MVKNGEKWLENGWFLGILFHLVMIPLHDRICQFFILIFYHCSYMILAAFPSETRS